MMAALGVIIDILSVLFLIKEFLWPVASKVFGLDKKLVGTAVASKAVSKVSGKFSRFPKWFITLFEKGGKLRWLRDIAYFLKNSMSAPIILGITFLLSAFCPTIFEKLMMIVGAVSIKIALVMVKWASGMMTSMPENNTQELYTILGDTIDALPPCFIDVLAYCHLVEDLGIIISTAIFCGIYNLIKYFYFKWL